MEGAVGADFRQARDDPWRGRDPVVTGGGERRRFEALSMCGGRYGRLDLAAAELEGALDAGYPTDRITAIRMAATICPTPHKTAHQYL
jgi:hypothetical protein